MSLLGTAAAATVLAQYAQDLLGIGKQTIGDITDSSKVSLPAYTRPLRLCSRVYIDATVSSDPVVTDIVKTVHTQYAAFILSALQMNQFVTSGRTVQDILHVVATEDNKFHVSVADDIFSDALEAVVSKTIATNLSGKEPKKTPEEEAKEKEKKDKDKPKGPYDDHGTAEGEVISFAGDNHIPAGKVIEVTLASPVNPKASITLNLLVQLAPYIIPAPLAVQFITKDVVPTFHQRWMQWRTGEISFWRDFVMMSDVVEKREKLRRMDKDGVIADSMGSQGKGRFRALENTGEKEKAKRARNIANSILIFSNETIQRAKVESGIDLSDPHARQKYFDVSFAMILVVVVMLYDQVTFYYNGIDECATFSFDQVKVGGKGGGNTDLVTILNALNQGKSPKF